MKKTIFSSLLLIAAMICHGQYNSDTRTALMPRGLHPDGAPAALSYYLPSGVSYNTTVPSPPAFLGFEVGEWHVSHDQLLSYMKTLAASSDRAVWEEYGRSWEGRSLGHLIISSPENMARLEEIRLNHLKLSDPTLSAGVNTAEMPLIIRLGYGIHGNESSAQNASLLTAYYLVAGRSAKIERILDNCIILLDPSLNPDGMQRHSGWVNEHRGMTLSSDPAGREFSEAWPGGRSNHYWFDLNRDYLLLQHPESVGRVASLHRWMPNINTDHHEMGASSSFFFQPGVPTRNNPVVPHDNQVMTAEIGNYHAQFLDSIGSLYYTEESFDDYYLGKGSSYPDAHGCVGILFEQAGTKGHLREVAGDLLTFPFAIRNQFVVSLSSLEAGLNLRVKLLDMQRDFYLTAIKEADASPVKGYLFNAGDDHGAAARFIENLLGHKIELYKNKKKISKNGVTYDTGDSYFVPTRQKEYRFVRTLFEPVSSFTDTVFYDITTWTMPMAFNLEYTAVTAAEAANMAGVKVTTPPFPEGAFAGSNSDIAWLFEWHDTYAAAALYMLQNAGLKARVATAPFTVMTGGTKRSFSYGTIMVHKGENNLPAGEITAILKKAAEECGISIYGVTSSLTPEGIDLGSGSFALLTKPSVALVVEDGISSLHAGEIWHLLDVRYSMPVTLLPSSRLGMADLSRYNVLILAGSPGLQSRVVDRIRDWARSGGTIIGYKRGNQWLSANGFAGISQVERVAGSSGKELSYANRSADRSIQDIPGSIFRADIDITHPLCYGYTRATLPIFKNDPSAVKVTGASYNTPVKYSAEPWLSGYCSKENLKRLAGSAVVEVHSGAGRVISIYDETNFRAIWYGSSKIFANALFFGQLVR